ncbi:MAG TPA: hypothetical protein VIV06_06890 [Candidatus Limnocylindrales bacterium]
MPRLPSNLAQSAQGVDDLVRVLLFAIVALALFGVATALFGWNPVGIPPFDLTIDPAGTLPF